MFTLCGGRFSCGAAWWFEGEADIAAGFPRLVSLVNGAARVEQIAADLALKIDTGQLHRWEELPRQSQLSIEYDVTERTITSAKSLLAVHRYLTLENGRYYVACSRLLSIVS